MESKILFKNDTTYTTEIAMEAGDAFWKIQPAYRKRAKRFKIVSGIMALTFALLGIISIISSGAGVASIGALVMAAVGVAGFIKGEQLIRGSAKNLRVLGTRVIYGISENFFFVLSREDVTKPSETDQDLLDEPEEDDQAALNAPAEEQEEQTYDAEADEENMSFDFEDEFLSLDDLLVCVVTENLYILIWEKPYYILDRRGFEDDKDGEFRQFIEEKARIIEA